MMKNILITLISLFPVLLWADEPMIFDYEWEKSPKLHELSETDQKIPELVLKDKLVMEFTFNSEGFLDAYKLHHVIIRVNSDDAINSNNKIYLPYYNTSDMVKQKVRVINSKGKVISLDEDDIKESKDEESGSTYKYFALEGVDLGSEIEYYFVIHSSPNYYGDQITLQSSVPKKNVEFTLISPSNLVMATKCYNGLPEPVQDETNKEQNVLTIQLDSIAGLKDEDFSNRDANLQFLVFKLDEDTYGNKRDFINYGKFTDWLFADMYAELPGSVEKKLKSLIKEMEVEGISSEEKQIRAVEDYVKTHFITVENSAEELSNIKDILSNKVANEDGMTKMLANIYRLLGIDHQIVVTNNRFDAKFDPDFEAYNFLTTYLLYFPGIEKFMEPGDNYARLGFLAPANANNYGLFIKSVSAGGYSSGVGKVKFIESLPHTMSVDNLVISVDLNADIIEPVYTIHRDQTGYYADNQLIYSLLDADTQEEIRESQITFISEDAEVKEVTLENTSAEDYGIKPLLTDGKFSTPEFVEKAGNQYLFKIGLLIGPQAEMYQESERHMEVENGFNRTYHRELTFVIPDGYNCTNLSDLNMDVFQEKGGERTMQFTSSYTVTGNTVKITIHEFYGQIIWPIEEFEAFRAVVNAAADFNKISLIFEPVQ